jgi:hypothetical protein
VVCLGALRGIPISDDCSFLPYIKYRAEPADADAGSCREEGEMGKVMDTAVGSCDTLHPGRYLR